jgi:WD40 repeat protein
LAIGGNRGDAAIRLWDLALQKQVGELTGPLDITYDLAFSPDGTILASAGGLYDLAVFLWDVEAQSMAGMIGGQSAIVASVDFAPNGKLLASTVSRNENIFLWDVRTQTQVAALTGHDPLVIGGGQAVISSDGKWLASNSDDGIELWELNLPGSDPIALVPEPSNRAEVVDHKPVLQWRPGRYAERHDVYFGSQFDDVNDAGNTDRTGPESVYRGRQEGNSYAVPEPLNFEQTYYWRID